MSTTFAAIVAAVVLVGLLVVDRRMRRSWVAASAKVDAALAQLPPVTAHDAGWDRLRQAIRDEQRRDQK